MRFGFGRFNMDMRKKRPDSFESGLLPLNVTGAQWRRWSRGSLLKEAARDAASQFRLELLVA
jgi:hypothetical protein